MKNTREFQVFADCNQFYLMDADVAPEMPEEVTEQDMLTRLRVAPHIVVFHTESATRVPVEVAFVSEPIEAVGAWEHQAEFVLALPSGSAALCGCTDFVPESPRMAVEPGDYIGRAYFAGSNSVEERYCIVLWPSTAQRALSQDEPNQAVPDH